MKAAGVMGAHPSATYLLMRRQIARFYSLLARVDWEYRKETITGLRSADKGGRDDGLSHIARGG